MQSAGKGFSKRDPMGTGNKLEKVEEYFRFGPAKVDSENNGCRLGGASSKEKNTIRQGRQVRKKSAC